jgi:carboxy-cis,cis-muconate cyclase
MYDILKNGTAELLSINLSPEVDDGPRNVYPSADGKWLYVVCKTEAHSFLLRP